MGAVALAATGVGIFADLSFAGALAVDSVALSAGAGATALDTRPCLQDHDKLACGGAAMGAAGLLFGGGAAAFDLVPALQASADAEAIAQILNIQSALFGLTGTAIDSYGLSKEVLNDDKAGTSNGRNLCNEQS